MNLARIALLIFGVGLSAAAQVDRRTGPASFKLATGAAMLAAYVLTGSSRTEKDGIKSVTKPPGVKLPHLPGRR